MADTQNGKKTPTHLLPMVMAIIAAVSLTFGITTGVITNQLSRRLEENEDKVQAMEISQARVDGKLENILEKIDDIYETLKEGKN